jgi:hypothetical protein
VTKGENADMDEESQEIENEVESRERKILKQDQSQNPMKDRQITAKVVGIIKRNWRT